MLITHCIVNWYRHNMPPPHMNSLAYSTTIDIIDDTSRRRYDINGLYHFAIGHRYDVICIDDDRNLEYAELEKEMRYL